MYPAFPSPSFFNSYGEYAATTQVPAAYNYAQTTHPVRHIPTQQLVHCSSPFRQPEEYVGVEAVVVYIGSVELNKHVKKVPMVARVSVIDYHGNVILDTYVRPTHHVEDYRSQETGLQPNDLINDVQLRVADTIKDKILVGHSLWNFLSVLGLSHPALYTRDLALFRPLRKKLQSKLVVSLPTLVHIYMRRNIGMEYEDSLELARASMNLFRCCEYVFERVIHDGAWPCNLPPSAFAEYLT